LKRYRRESGYYIPNGNLRVKREVKDEFGIDIKNIKFFGSHPWPFFKSLMLGFTAEYSSGELVIDNNEIEVAY
jgi:NAD+ diphosphatase